MQGGSSASLLWKHDSRHDETADKPTLGLSPNNWIAITKNIKDMKVLQEGLEELF